MIDQLVHATSSIASSGILLHLGYVLLVFMLFLDKRKQQLILDQALHKNLLMGDQLDGMRIELKQLHSELVSLIKENHSLNLEIQLLTQQVNALREEVHNSKKQGLIGYQYGNKFPNKSGCIIKSDFNYSN